MSSVDLLGHRGAWRAFGAARLACSQPTAVSSLGVPICLCPTHQYVAAAESQSADNENAPLPSPEGSVKGGIGLITRLPVVSVAKEKQIEELHDGVQGAAASAVAVGSVSGKLEGFATEVSVAVGWDSSVIFNRDEHTGSFQDYPRSIVSRAHESVVYIAFHANYSREDPWQTADRSAMVAGMPTLVVGIVFVTDDALQSRSGAPAARLFIELLNARCVYARDVAIISSEMLIELTGGLISLEDNLHALPLRIRVSYDPTTQRIDASTLHGATSVSIDHVQLETVLTAADGDRGIFASVGAHFTRRCARVMKWEWEGSETSHWLPEQARSSSSPFGDPVARATDAASSALLLGQIPVSDFDDADQDVFTETLLRVQATIVQYFDNFTQTVLDPLRSVVDIVDPELAPRITQTFQRNVNMIGHLAAKLEKLLPTVGLSESAQEKLRTRRATVLSHFFDIFFANSLATVRDLWMLSALLVRPKSLATKFWQDDDFRDVEFVWPDFADGRESTAENNVDAVCAHKLVLQARAPRFWADVERRLVPTLNGTNDRILLLPRDASEHGLTRNVVVSILQTIYSVNAPEAVAKFAEAETETRDAYAQEIAEDMFSRDLPALLQDDSTCDLTIICNDPRSSIPSVEDKSSDDNVIAVKAHRAVLAVFSEPFRSLLQQTQTTSITLRTSADSTRALVSYAYTGAFPPDMVPSTAFALFCDCGQLLDEGALAQCEFIVRSGLLPSNCVEVFLAAKNQNRRSLAQACVGVMAAHANVTINSPGFALLADEDIQRLCEATDKSSANLLRERFVGALAPKPIGLVDTPQPHTTTKRPQPKKAQKHRRRR